MHVEKTQPSLNGGKAHLFYWKYFLYDLATTWRYSCFYWTLYVYEVSAYRHPIV